MTHKNSLSNINITKFWGSRRDIIGVTAITGVHCPHPPIRIPCSVKLEQRALNIERINDEGSNQGSQQADIWKPTKCRSRPELGLCEGHKAADTSWYSHCCWGALVTIGLNRSQHLHEDVTKNASQLHNKSSDDVTCSAGAFRVFPENKVELVSHFGVL